MSLLKSKTFVDKSQFIRIVDEYPFVTVAAPPDCGKSTHLLMMKKFFELPFDIETLEPINNLIDKNGVEIKSFKDTLLEDIKEKEKLTENFKFFKNLKIYSEKKSSDQDFFYRNCERYPVIQMNFKEINPLSAGSLRATLQTMVYRIFQYHSYLIKSQKLLRPEKSFLEMILDPNRFDKWQNEGSVRLSLRNLTKFLSIHFGQPCVVLIDDLDSLTEKMLIRNKKSEIDLKFLFLHLGTMLSHLLKNNLNVKYGVMTVRKLLPWSISHHVDHFESVSIMRDKFYSDFFGVTEAELGNLLRNYNIEEADPEKLQMMKYCLDNWDDGCDFWWDEEDKKRRSEIRNKKLYSFASVKECLRRTIKID